MRSRARVLIPILGAIILASLGVTYYFTVEPALTVKVRWRATVTPDQRSDLERQFLLVRPVLDQGRTYRYDLLDTSPSNMEALVRDPAVEDTADIDTVHYTLPPDYPYGTSWTWAAYRVPILRAPGVVETVVGISAMTLVVPAVWVVGSVVSVLRKARAQPARKSDVRPPGAPAE